LPSPPGKRENKSGYFFHTSKFILVFSSSFLLFPFFKPRSSFLFLSSPPPLVHDLHIYSNSVQTLNNKLFDYLVKYDKNVPNLEINYKFFAIY